MEEAAEGSAEEARRLFMEEVTRVRAATGAGN
jgi:hypothetical protein